MNEISFQAELRRINTELDKLTLGDRPASAASLTKENQCSQQPNNGLNSQAEEFIAPLRVAIEVSTPPSRDNLLGSGEGIDEGIEDRLRQVEQWIVRQTRHGTSLFEPEYGAHVTALQTEVKVLQSRVEELEGRLVTSTFTPPESISSRCTSIAQLVSQTPIPQAQVQAPETPIQISPKLHATIGVFQSRLAEYKHLDGASSSQAHIAKRDRHTPGGSMPYTSDDAALLVDKLKTSASFQDVRNVGHFLDRAATFWHKLFDVHSRAHEHNKDHNSSKAEIFWKHLAALNNCSAEDSDKIENTSLTAEDVRTINAEFNDFVFPTLERVKQLEICDEARASLFRYCIGRSCDYAKSLAARPEVQNTALASTPPYLFFLASAREALTAKALSSVTAKPEQIVQADHASFSMTNRTLKRTGAGSVDDALVILSESLHFIEQTRSDLALFAHGQQVAQSRNCRRHRKLIGILNLREGAQQRCLLERRDRYLKMVERLERIGNGQYILRDPKQRLKYCTIVEAFEEQEVARPRCQKYCHKREQRRHDARPK